MNDYIIITQNCEEAYLVSYYIAGIIPIFFLIFYTSFFAYRNVVNINSEKNLIIEGASTINFIDYNSQEFFKSRMNFLIYTLIVIGFLYTKLFQSYPMIIVYSDTVPLAFDPFIYYTLMFLIAFFLLLSQLVYRYKLDLKKEELLYLSFFIFSALIILIQVNLIGIFISVELFSISSYLLVTGLGNKISIEAAIKYSLIGVLGTIFFLLGITFCYLNYGTINLHNIVDQFSQTDLEILGGLFFIIAIFLKLGVVPFHYWIVDVYKGTSPVTFIWLVTISKVVLIFLLITILEHVIMQLNFFYKDIFIGLGLLSIIIGSIGGLRQSNLKGLIVYSSIVTLGFILLPFSYYSIDATNAITLSISYLVVYVFNLVSFLFFVSKIKNVSHLFNDLYGLGNIIKSNPVLALGFIITLFSFMGFPPLLGFYPKILILQSLLSFDYQYTVIICIVCTLYTSGFYFSIIKQLTLLNFQTYLSYEDLSFFDYILITFLLFMNMFIFFFFSDITSFIWTLL